MTAQHRVTVRKSNGSYSSDLRFDTLDAAHAEWFDRCSQGQHATLWSWQPETDEHDAGWEPLLCHLEFDDVRDELSRLGSAVDEHDDDHRRDMRSAP